MSPVEAYFASLTDEQRRLVQEPARTTSSVPKEGGGKEDHPSHYNSHPSGVECIDVTEHMTFNLGNAVKYIWRHGLKSGETADEDLAKAEWYIRRERDRLKKKVGP